MASYGLNRAQREIVKVMVLRGESGGRVRGEIQSMMRSDGWDYEANVAFCSWLAREGYYETAKYLECKINDH